MTAISPSTSPSRTSAAEVTRQTIRPKEADYQHTRAFFLPLVDGPPPVSVRRPTPTTSPTSLARTRELTGGLGSVAWDEPGGVEVTGPGPMRTVRGPVCVAGRPFLAPAGYPPIPGAEGGEGQW
jgi:hypothetical protein